MIEDDDDIQDYKKPWVGLTEEEFVYYSSYIYPEVLAEIENLLKEKNI